MVNRNLERMETTNLLDAYFHWECHKLSSVTTFHCLYSVPKSFFPVVPIRGAKLSFYALALLCWSVANTMLYLSSKRVL